MKPALLAAAFLLGLLIGVGLSGRAEDYVIVSGLAKHLDGKQHCNSTTTGLGYEHSQSENWRSQIGFYRNSNCRWSAYAAEAWMPLHLGNLSLGLLGGVVSGYASSILPAGGIVTAYRFKNWKLNLITIPPVGNSSDGVLWLQAGIAW